MGNKSFKPSFSVSKKPNNTFAIKNGLENNVSLPAVKSRTEKFFPSMRDMLIDIDKLVPAPDEWNVFPAPPEGIYMLIKESIRNQGQLDPIRVWEQHDGTYMILGGHTRFRIFRELLEETGDEYYKEMKCHVYEEDQIDAFDAQEIIIIDNAVQRAQENTFIKIRMVATYDSILKQRETRTNGVIRKRITEEIGERLGIGQTTVKRFMALKNAYIELVKLYDEKAITQETLRAFGQLPDELQKYIYDKELYKKELDKFQLHEIPDASNVQDINNIFRQKKRYEFSGDKIIISHPVPKSFKRFSLAADKEDMEYVIDIFSDALNKTSKVTPETKETLLEILNNLK